MGDTEVAPHRLVQDPQRALQAGRIDGVGNLAQGQVGGRQGDADDVVRQHHHHLAAGRSEEHTSELQSLMRISYAVFCLKKKKKQTEKRSNTTKDMIKVHT